MKNNVLEMINDGKLATFLNSVFNSYSKSVEYHNDLHGIDVA